MVTLLGEQAGATEVTVDEPDGVVNVNVEKPVAVVPLDQTWK